MECGGKAKRDAALDPGWGNPDVAPGSLGMFGKSRLHSSGIDNCSMKCKTFIQSGVAVPKRRDSATALPNALDAKRVSSLQVYQQEQ